MTPKKPESEKKRPGRPRKDPASLQVVPVPVRLTAANALRLDAVTANRTEFARVAIMRAVAAEEKRALSRK